MGELLYINGMGMISPQGISAQADGFFGEQINYTENRLFAVAPNYRKHLKPAAMRRMSKAVKMGVFASFEALEDAHIKQFTAIITGTGMGCKEDSDAFLEELLARQEQLVSPTKFIQSTHNTVSGQIALQLGCNAYNFTYVQGAASFESALFDALISSEKNDGNQHFLVGGVDEISQNPLGKSQLSGFLKAEDTDNEPLFSAKKPGIVRGEGAGFFVAGNKKTEETYACLRAVKIFNHLSSNQLETELHEFLAENELRLENIDAVMLGANSDAKDQEQMTVFRTNLFPNTLQVQYKHLVGEFPTASAIGFGMACKALKQQKIPQHCILKTNPSHALNKILLYNQYRGRDHSFTILERC